MMTASLLAAGLLGAGFIWGLLAHRDGIFPYTLFRSLARKTGMDTLPTARVAARPADLEALVALPYVGGSFDPESSSRGVLIHDPEKSAKGLNFYVSETTGAALLLDMDGAPVHTWRFAVAEFKYATLLPGGEVLAVDWSHALIKIDKDSQVLWSYRADLHHDVWIDASGDVYALTQEPRLIPQIHPSIEVADDVIVVLSPDGEETDKISLCDAVMSSPYAFLLPSASHLDLKARSGEDTGFTLDVLHANHVEVFDGRLAGRSDLFAEGNLLVSMRYINTIAILEKRTREILWLWGPGNLTYQHHPVLLDNGNIMIFNNGSGASSTSQILELDPFHRTVVWVYQDPGEFFTLSRGSNQRLANGNTLITESNTGYVFEVTRQGEIVWEFANPQVDEKGVREDIWRMTRFDYAELTFLSP